MTADININSPYHHVAKFDDQSRTPDFLKDVLSFPDLHTADSHRGGMAPSGKDKIEGMEPINKITVPDQWSKEVTEARFGEVAKSVSFSPPDGEGTELALYDRGFPIAQTEGDNFRAVLEKEPHVLDQKEISTLNEQVLGSSVGDRSAFDLKHAETKLINGKKVLTVEGDWKDGGKKFFGCYIPKDDSFREIQEVYFEGAEPSFSKFRPEAEKAVSSITWKKPE